MTQRTSSGFPSTLWSSTCSSHPLASLPYVEKRHRIVIFLWKYYCERPLNSILSQHQETLTIAVHLHRGRGAATLHDRAHINSCYNFIPSSVLGEVPTRWSIKSCDTAPINAGVSQNNDSWREPGIKNVVLQECECDVRRLAMCTFKDICSWRLVWHD